MSYIRYIYIFQGTLLTRYKVERQKIWKMSTWRRGRAVVKCLHIRTYCGYTTLLYCCVFLETPIHCTILYYNITHILYTRY